MRAEPMTERAVEGGLARSGRGGPGGLYLDGRDGVLGGDHDALKLIRETGRPVMLAVNKIDRPGQETKAADCYALGIESITFVSAAHGRGVGGLLDEVVAPLPPRGPPVVKADVSRSSASPTSVSRPL